MRLRTERGEKTRKKKRRRDSIPECKKRQRARKAVPAKQIDGPGDLMTGDGDAERLWVPA
jgi:hypothetical protein